MTLHRNTKPSIIEKVQLEGETIARNTLDVDGMYSYEGALTLQLVDIIESLKVEIIYASREHEKGCYQCDDIGSPCAWSELSKRWSTQ